MLTRRLWLSMGFHVSWNYTQSAIFSGIVSGNDPSQGLIRSTMKGPDLLTGGSFGVESSVLALILCTTTGIVMLVMAVRRGRGRAPGLEAPAWGISVSRLVANDDRMFIATLTWHPAERFAYTMVLKRSGARLQAA